MLHQMNAGKLVICHHRLILLATNFQNLVLDSVSFKFVFLISFTKDPPPTLTFAVVSVSLPPANEVWGKVIFLHLSAILFTPGGYLGRYPQAGTPPGPGTPSEPGTPPGTRYTPSPGPGTPPGTRYTPSPGPGTPPSQGPGTPPGTRYTPLISAWWEIRTTSGRYASYWNAFLFWNNIILRCFNC